MSETIEGYRSGTGKVLAVGDFVKVDGREALYRITGFHHEHDEVFVDCYGGRDGRYSARSFHVDRCSRVLRPPEKAPWAGKADHIRAKKARGR